jgi:rhodanese-related sulfurtransferase
MQQFLEYATHHPFLVAGAALMAILVAVQEYRLRTASFGSVSPADAVRLMNSGALLIDVRRREDYDAGHISGARFVPGETIADGAESLSRFKEKTIIAYCDTGMTAGSAARHLGRLGFKHALNLRGGIAGWRQDNLPVVKD